jgi:hypothetical protein
MASQADYADETRPIVSTWQVVCASCAIVAIIALSAAGLGWLVVLSLFAGLCTLPATRRLAQRLALTIPFVARRSQNPFAMAELLDEVGACARGELPPPDQDQLEDWLRLLNIVAGSDAENDSVR